MRERAWAIVWAQWRSLRNIRPRSGVAGLLVSAVGTVVWYGAWLAVSVAVAALVRETSDPEKLRRLLGPGLLLAFLYWQVIPVMMVSSGASLQMRQLKVYPIPRSELFTLEVLLRITTALEMALVLAGASIGLLLNGRLNGLFAAAFLPYVLFNLYLSTGVRDLLTRVLNRRRMRETGVLIVVLVAALPQILLQREGSPWKRLESMLPDFPWPWTVTAQLVSGHWTAGNGTAMLVWLVAAYAFGRSQFERGLNFDEEAARASGGAGRECEGWQDRIYRLPSAVLPDPLGTMVEKELRSLIRSPRFRVAFLMGFSFGLLVWLPMALGGKSSGGWLGRNVLVVLFSYSLLLLSEVSIWNVLGFDRSAAQVYWLAPVRLWQMLAAKNVAIALFFLLEMAIITLVCVALGLRVTLLSLSESALVCYVMMVFLMSVGNLSSVYTPRGVDGNQTWKRGSAGRFQAMLLLIYPVLLLPFAFAYWAREVWESTAVFYGVVGFTAALAVIAYGLAMEHAVRVAGARREQILTALAQGGGPVAA
jgi:ABC-2 type transport system permease protein